MPYLDAYPTSMHAHAPAPLDCTMHLSTPLYMILMQFMVRGWEELGKRLLRVKRRQVWVVGDHVQAEEHVKQHYPGLEWWVFHF